MIRLAFIVVVAAALFTSACKSPNPGSREYIPGKGWKPVR